MRRKFWDIEETINAIEKLHKDNYDAIELLLDIVSNDMKKPDGVEINGGFKDEQSRNKEGTMSEQSKIHMVLRKDKNYGRVLYYTKIKK